MLAMVNKNGISVGTDVLNNVAYSPQMKYNLCSHFKLMEDRWKMKRDDKGILMVKKGNKPVFDIVVRIETGLVFCPYIKQMSNEIACPSIKYRRPWSINDAHELSGHPGKDVTQEIVKGLKLNVQQRPMVTCWACTVAKAKQKNIMQFSLHKKRQVPGEMVFLDCHLCNCQQEWQHCPSLIAEFWWMNVLTLKFLISSTEKIRWQRQLASFSRSGKIRAL